MELNYTLKGLDCPHCAAKIEHEIAALPEVAAAAVNLIRGSLTVQPHNPASESLNEIIIEIVHRYEPDVDVLPQISQKAHAHEHDHKHAHDHDHEHDHDGCCCEHEHAHEHGDSHTMLLRIVIGAVLFGIGMLFRLGSGNVFTVCSAGMMLAAYALAGWDVVWHALKNIARGRVFDEHFLMTVSTVGALAMREFPEAAAVMLLYQTGELFQSAAVQRSRKSVKSLLEICPDTAHLLNNDALTDTHCEEIAVGDTIVVKPGERIPLDGTVLSGDSMLDTSALTGESVPRRVQTGDAVLSGCMNQSGMLTVSVTKPFRASTAARIIDMVENASARKAPAENFITSFARYYTPVVVIAAVLLAAIPPLAFGGLWSEWIRRALVFLVISCPCALVISIPLTYFGGIGAASKQGVLVKGGNYLDALYRVTQIAFDKTGTLTQGVFQVKRLLPAEGCTEARLLAQAAACEQSSNHPIAQSVMQAFGTNPPAACEDMKELAGRGIAAVCGGQQLLAGNAKLMEEYGIAYTPCQDAGTKVYVAADGQFSGCILIADAYKADSRTAIQQLRDSGIRQMIMLTGDDKHIAEAAANELGLDDFAAELLPDQKLRAVEEMMKPMPEGEKLAFVGDGINDAPVLARADLGIAMGALGSDAAIEAADIVLMTDEVSKLYTARRIAKKTRRIVTENIAFALGVKAALLILGACGLTGMWAAVFGDVGVAIIAVLNAMRMLRE